jgi:hypothetical protein
LQETGGDMAVIAEDEDGGVPGLRPDLAQLVLAEGEYSQHPSESRPTETRLEWRVVIHVREHLISRSVCYDDAPWLLGDQDRDEVIWPTWPATLADEIAAAASPLADLQQHWDGTVSRLRDSAKWMAAVLGAALASIIPTAPLADHLRGRPIPAAAAAAGVVGLLLVSITMLLVLQVMRPQLVSFADIQDAQPPSGFRGMLHSHAPRNMPPRYVLENPLYSWQITIRQDPDLYLPCGVDSLTELRQSIIVEEMTLVALARARESSGRHDVHEKLNDAQAARSARLHELRAAAAAIIAMGVYHKVRARSTWATFGGVTFGFLGIVAIVAAVAWPVH